MGGFLSEIFLSNAAAVKARGSLLKLRPHLQGPVILTGGLALGWHLLQNGVRRAQHLNDLDLVVEGTSSLKPSLSKDFLISHFHPSREKGKILIMLVDEEHYTRIDVFTPHTSSLAQRWTDFDDGELSLKIISAEDLLAKLLSIIYAVAEGRTVDPKYFEHFNSLSQVADLKTAGGVWKEYRKENQPLDFNEAAEAVRRAVNFNPALLKASLYSQDLNQTCAWCCVSEQFPLAQPPKIYEILGYV